MRFRYARRTMWRWHPFAVTGMSKEEAVKMAKETESTYEGSWLQASADGLTWVDVPPAKEIPLVDDTVEVTGKVWGG